jgi:hypothetical protein
MARDFREWARRDDTVTTKMEPRMSGLRLTKRTVDELKPRDRPYIVFDTDLKGFGIRIMTTGKMTWILE